MGCRETAAEIDLQISTKIVQCRFGVQLRCNVPLCWWSGREETAREGGLRNLGCTLWGNLYGHS